MLLPVSVSPRSRLWVDVSFRYEKYVFADTSEEVSKYVLKYGHVDGVYPDEQIAHEVRRTVAALLRDGVPCRQVIDEVSMLYGIPPGCVEEVVASMPVIRGDRSPLSPHP